MFNRLCRHLLLVLAIMLAVAPVPAAIVLGAPVRVPIRVPVRIIAIGDLHGDHDAWRQIAVAAGLIDRKGNWAGGPTILVQTGDVPDRGPETLKIIADLQRLQKQAPRAGGQVFALVGNHEAMNVTGDLRYVTPAAFARLAGANSAALRDRIFAANQPAIVATARQTGDPALTDAQIRAEWDAAHPLGWVEHRIAWSPQGRIGKWIVANPAVLKLGDTLFVHGGIGPAHAATPIPVINNSVKSALLAQDTGPEAIINAADGPLWYRGLAQQPDAVVSAELDALLGAQGATRIVIGHTPSLQGVSVRHQGRLVLIDTGISAAMAGTLGWLEIADGVAIPHQLARAALP